MRNIWYTVTFLITLYWALGTFIWDLGVLVHALLAMAVWSFVMGVHQQGRHA